MKRYNPERRTWRGRSYKKGGAPVRELKEAAEAQDQETIFECRCCGAAIGGTVDGRFGYDARGPWRRIGRIDGRNAICPVCVQEPDCLEGLVRDGYDNACIEV